MAETPQEYKARILAQSQGQEPLKTQAATAGRLEKLIKGASPKLLGKNPAPGKWSVKEILAHLAESEIVGGFRIRLILGSNGTPVAAFDQDDWARAGNYARRDPKKSIALFRAVREANLDLLKALTPEQWRQYGLHSERGEETLETIARMFAGHDLNHIRQIEAILGTPGRARKKSRR
jgi:hypothetical protein